MRELHWHLSFDNWVTTGVMAITFIAVANIAASKMARSRYPVVKTIGEGIGAVTPAIGG